MYSLENDIEPLEGRATAYCVALSMLPLVGGVVAKQLINYCGSAEAVFTTQTAHLSKIPGIGPKITQSIRNYRVVLAQAEQELERCQEQGIQIITYQSPHYPQRLKQIYDAPIVLYYRGTAHLDHARIISIVGTRRATTYGKNVVQELVAALVAHDVLIVSGLAYGIDIAAHRAALEAQVPTVGVMASGLDIIYPAVHRNDAAKMVESGGLLSESPLGTPPDAPRFPARNRIIAGLSDAVIVVEAAEKGGALITANLANDYDREVFAVPGSIYQPYSRGCHRLIKAHKAHLLTEADDLVKALNWDLPAAQRMNALPFGEGETLNAHSKYVPAADLAEDEKLVVEALAQQPQGMLIDELSWKSQIPVSQLASTLLNLEFKHMVKALPGRKFRLTSY